MGAAITLRTLRALARENFDPVSICFCHGRPSRLEVHNRVLGARIDFTHSFDAIVCRSRALDLPIESADPELGAALKRRLDQQLIEPGDKPRDRVRQIVRVLIPSGEVPSSRAGSADGSA